MEQNISKQPVTRTKSASNKFHKQNPFMRRNYMYLFQEEKNTHVANFTNKNQHIIISTNKKSASSKFNEQNEFHEAKTQCTSFTKRKIHMLQVSQTKISTQQAQGTNISKQQVP